MTDRPMHEVVSECEAHHTVYSVDDDRGAIETEFLAIPRTELAAVLKAADALRARVAEVMEWHAKHGGDPGYESALQDEHKGHDYDLTGISNAYDAAVADLRRVLEGK